jgi:hypothetical protein
LKSTLIGQRNLESEMIDSVVASNFEFPVPIRDFVSGLKENLSTDYKLREINIPYVKAKIYNHAYRKALKFEHIDGSRKYFLVKFDPRPDYVGIPVVKIKTEVSGFRDNREFQYELFNVCNSDYWRFLLENHCLTELHTKCDISRYDFEDMRISLDYPFSRNPHIAVNKVNGYKTLYISKNNYLYEKPAHLLRSEMRHSGIKRIKRKVGISKLTEFDDIKTDNFLDLYKDFKFWQPYQLKETKNWEEYEWYKTFLYYLNQDSQKVIKSKRGEYFKRFDSFLNAKNEIDKRTDRRFSKRLIPRLRPRNISLKEDLINEYHNFKGVTYER